MTGCEYYERCRRFIKAKLNLLGTVFSEENKYDECFCKDCHERSGRPNAYRTGNPEQNAVHQIGWARFELDVHDHKIVYMKIHQKWHVAFHGTEADTVKPILDANMLLLPGDIVLGGDKLEQRKEHTEEHDEKFDPKNIFVSPSIKYVEQKSYAKSVSWIDEHTSTEYDAKVAFEVWIRPGSYEIHGQTLEAGSERIDEYFRNDSLEWFTKERPATVLYGLLIKLDSKQKHWSRFLPKFHLFWFT
ncbi:neuralized-like protein 4 [Ptychodera flava]|uniref:neuralized-like protein 4 n=1 Tax=Ptychodera flava TaxID=63121 RepID=UPI00396A1B42